MSRLYWNWEVVCLLFLVVVVVSCSTARCWSTGTGKFIFSRTICYRTRKCLCSTARSRSTRTGMFRCSIGAGKVLFFFFFPPPPPLLVFLSVRQDAGVLVVGSLSVRQRDARYWSTGNVFVLFLFLFYLTARCWGTDIGRFSVRQRDAGGLALGPDVQRGWRHLEVVERIPGGLEWQRHGDAEDPAHFIASVVCCLEVERHPQASFLRTTSCFHVLEGNLWVYGMNLMGCSLDR